MASLYRIIVTGHTFFVPLDYDSIEIRDSDLILFFFFISRYKESLIDLQQCI